MARQLHKLNARSVDTANHAGRISDGGGLYLRVKDSGAKSWSFKWKRGGGSFELAIGPYPAISLANARKQATAWREIVALGGDPRAEKAKSGEPTFAECVEQFLDNKENEWSNAKHRQQWRSTLATYCKPISTRKVSDIRLDDILQVLKPIWNVKPETASRLRGRIERVLSYAQTRGWRSDANPAIWRGNLQNILPKPRKLVRGHHAALSWEAMPDFMDRLQRHQALTARALKFLILTATRSGETLEARWEEIDLNNCVWTIPAERMKTRKEHRVPLTEQAMVILEPLNRSKINEFVFPGQKANRPISGMAMHMLLRRMKQDRVTVHGFRSSFRDWAGDQTSFAREIAEGCLAHTIGNAAEQAYRRSDALEKRRQLMQAWANYCTGGYSDNVVTLL